MHGVAHSYFTLFAAGPSAAADSPVEAYRRLISQQVQMLQSDRSSSVRTPCTCGLQLLARVH